MPKTFHFVAGLDHGIPVALCLEHDLATQARSIDELPDACLEMLMMVRDVDRSEELDPWTRPAPPYEAVADIRTMPGFWEFTVTLEDA